MAEIYKCTYRYVGYERLHPRGSVCGDFTNRKLVFQGVKVPVCVDHVLEMKEELWLKGIPFTEEYNRDQPDSGRTSSGLGLSPKAEGSAPKERGPAGYTAFGFAHDPFRHW